jgi:uncharacterized protein RhaS with RHS repeats
MYISQDPVRLRAGLKFYAYVENPSSWIDPYGLVGKCNVRDATKQDGDCDVVLTIRKSDFRDQNQAISHIEDVMEKRGNIYTYRPENADSQRAKSLKGIPTISGKDRDEFPMAIFDEGGTGASVRPIASGDNRSVGSAIGGALRGQESGTRVKIVITD